MRIFLAFSIFLSAQAMSNSLSQEYLSGQWCEVGLSNQANSEIKDSYIPWHFDGRGVFRFGTSQQSYRINNNELIIDWKLGKTLTPQRMTPDSLVLKSDYGFLHIERGECVLSDASKKKLEVMTFHNAVSDGDIAKATQYIERGFDVNAPYPGSYIKSGALHLAAQYQREELIQILLDYGGDPERKNAKGLTPISYAEQKTNRRILAMLKGESMPKESTQEQRSSMDCIQAVNHSNQLLGESMKEDNPDYYELITSAPFVQKAAQKCQEDIVYQQGLMQWQCVKAADSVDVLKSCKS